jgi:hypothetical protein
MYERIGDRRRAFEDFTKRYASHPMKIRIIAIGANGTRQSANETERSKILQKQFDSNRIRPITSPAETLLGRRGIGIALSKISIMV